MLISLHGRSLRRLSLAMGISLSLGWLPLASAAEPQPASLTADIAPLEQPTEAAQPNSQRVEARDGFIPATAPEFAADSLRKPQSNIQQTSFLSTNLSEYVADPSDLLPDSRLSPALWRMPDMMGTLLRLGPAHDVTFRPFAVTPPPSPGTVVLDAANNRFVYIDGANETLVPAAPNLGSDFVTFIAPGGGNLNTTAATLPDGTRGYFGLTRVTQDGVMGNTTQTLPGFDLLSQTPPGSMTITTIGVTNPVSMAGYNAEPHTAHFSVSGPSPTNPSLAPVGVKRQADGGSPIPRNRVFFNYSYFDAVAMGSGVNMNRFTPGFETLLADGLMSLEARFPFATTLDSSQVINGAANANEIEFGNVSLALKTIIASSSDWLISGGLQMTLPTADDYSLSIADRGATAEFLRLDNDIVHLMPFVGLASAPNDRFFMQSIVQFDFDARGRNVLLNANALNGGSLSSVGRLNDASFLYLDSSIGYWLLSDPEESNRMITGVAPTFELHAATAISDADSVNFAPIGKLGTGREYNILTATYGCVFELYHNSLLTVGYSTPLQGGLNEDFDGELRVMFSRRFGSR